MRFYTDSRLHAMLETQTQTQSIGGKKKSFWDKAGFPLTAVNGSSGADVVVTNPWADSGPMAPFDQCGYCRSIVDLNSPLTLLSSILFNYQLGGWWHFRLVPGQ